MKKIFQLIPYSRNDFFLIVILVSCSFISVKMPAQSIITKSVIHDHSSNINYSTHVIYEFKPLRPDDYNLAMDQQLGVIGSDFHGIQELHGIVGNYGVWKPITGYKETMCGPLLSFYKRTPNRLAGEDAESRDDDIHFTLIPTLGGVGLYQDALLKMKPSKKEILPEIDISDDVYIEKMRKYTSNVPKQEIDYVSVYGPWVFDVGHNENVEIHPTEQVWWVNRKGNKDNYHLYTFLDTSDRIPLSDWTGIPYATTFALAIKGRLHTPCVKIDIGEIGKRNISISYTDSKKHYLIYNRDTLAIVNENTATDILEIKFEKVGLDPFALLNNVKDSVFTGFVVIRSQINSHGALLLNCDIEDRKTTNITSA